MRSRLFIVTLSTLIVGNMLATAAYSKQTVGLNGVAIDLSGNFYAPNNAQILQDEPPVIEFDGLSQTGGQQIVNGYREAFGADVMGDHIRSKLKEVDEKIGDAGREAVLAVLPEVNEKFPELIVSILKNFELRLR